ncbi:hypothetical protein ABZV87_31045 [Streptomyces tendae]|uniref:hypothetical protein n=1 Tax=Streptomyces tendae TaxID=1932 RepID=UPI0033BD7AE4
MTHPTPTDTYGARWAPPLLDGSNAPLGLFCGAWARSQRLGLREVRGPTHGDRRPRQGPRRRPAGSA